MNFTASPPLTIYRCPNRGEIGAPAQSDFRALLTTISTVLAQSPSSADGKAEYHAQNGEIEANARYRRPYYVQTLLGGTHDGVSFFVVRRLPNARLANQGPLSPWSAGLIQLAENQKCGLGEKEGEESLCLTKLQTTRNLAGIHTKPSV